MKNGAVVACEVRVFPLKVKRQQKSWPERGQREIQWFSRAKAAKVVKERALGDIIRSVRSDGFAITDEELELGLRSIAVPVKTHQNKVVAAMNIGVQAARVSAAEMIHRFLPILQENAGMLAPLLR